MTRIARLDYPPVEIRMYVSTPIEETHRIVACAKEPWTTQWIESMPPGSVLYDVGANVGPYTLLAAALGHTVVAIEPSYANYARLCENILLNDLGPKVIPLCLAVSSSGGIELMEQHNEPGYSGGAKRLRVPMLPLIELETTFGVPSPTHIKIDTDGSEADVIVSAGGTYSTQSWMVEVQTGQEERINALLGQPKAIFDQRNGHKIVGMSMALYEPG